MIKVVTSDDQTIIFIITWTLPNRKIPDLPLAEEIRDLKTLPIGFSARSRVEKGARWGRGESLNKAAWCPLRLTFRLGGKWLKKIFPKIPLVSRHENI